jgi:hypothetical protein
MFSLVALCVVVAVAHAAADASFSAFQLTLNMALSSKKRQASSCSPAEVMAIQGAAQAVTACLQGVSSSNNTQLCGCYTTVSKREKNLQKKFFFFSLFRRLNDGTVHRRSGR